MSWVTIIWSMVASACLTLGGMHLLVWFKDRRAWTNLLFFLSAAGTSCFAAGEFWMMRSQTTAQYGAAMRFTHVPVWLLVVPLVFFVRLYLRAGRPWLGWLVCGLRTLALLLNFLTGQNLNYREITRLGHIPFLGESVSVAEGVRNPWMLVGQLGTLLLVAFVADATLSVWRRGDRRQAIVLGGSIVFFSVCAFFLSMLVLWGFVHLPITVTVFYMGIIVAMAYELSRDTIRAAQLGTELQETELRLTMAADAANLGVWTRDFKRNEIWATDKWRALFGFSKSQRLALNDILQRLHPDDREGFRQTLAEAAEGKDSYETEYRVVLPDGQVRWIASRGRVEFNGNGKPIFGRGASLDVSERKQAEESRKNLAAIVESSDDAILSYALEGTITSWNAGAERIYGYSANEIIGQHVSMLATDGLKTEVAEIFKKISRGESVDHLETKRVTKNGRQIDISVTISPLRNEHDVIIGASTIARDITASKHAESEIQQQRGELAHLDRVTMLGELSASMAHELNQPLTAILSNAQAAQRFLAHDDVDLDEVRDILGDIVEQDHRAGEVIRRLRLLLRKGEVQKQSLDVNSVVLEVVNLLRSDLANQDVTARTELASALPNVTADRVQLQQVLLNLVMNACDAMNGNAYADRQVVVSTELCDGETIRFSVSDRGAGIAPNQLEKIFDPFFSTKTHGLGMGLAVCRTIISAHGGKLWADNNPEQGATFYFTLRY